MITVVTCLTSATEKMVKCNFVDGRTTRKGADMSALAFVLIVSANDHCHRIPANDALDPSLHLSVARIRRLLGGWDGVYIRCIGVKGDLNTGAACPVLQRLDEILKHVHHPCSCERNPTNPATRQFLLDPRQWVPLIGQLRPTPKGQHPPELQHPTYKLVFLKVPK